MDRLENQPFRRPKLTLLEKSDREDDARIIQQGWRENRFSIEGKRTNVVGVRHTPRTVDLLVDEMEQTIKNSSVVLLEGSPASLTKAMDAPASFAEEEYPTQSQVDAFRETLKKASEKGVELATPPDKLNDREIRQEIIKYQDKLDSFFQKVRHIAALHGKPIAFADPLESVRKKYDEKRQAYIKEHGSDQGFHKLPSEEVIIRDKIFYGGAAVAAALGFAARATQNKMNRRSFLKIAGAGAAVSAVGGISKLAEEIENAAFKKHIDLGRASNPLGAFRYDWVDDYREVVAGVALQRLAATYKDVPGDVSSVYGGAHAESIKHYALSPNEAPLRLRAYPHRNEYDEPTLAVYEFDAALHEWKQKSKEALL